MQYRTAITTADGAYSIIVVDDFQAPFNLGISVENLSGPADGTALYTLDDPNTFDPVLPGNTNWFAVPGLTSVTAIASAQFTTPCRAIALLQNDSGSMQMRVVQAGPA